MRKKWMAVILISVLFLTMAAWGSNGNNTNKTNSQETEQAGNGIVSQKDDSETKDKASVETMPEESKASVETQSEENNDPHILIAYFSRVGNTDLPEGIDALSSASFILKDGEIYGNTQYIATLIEQYTDGDLFLIETEEKYPADHDETDEQGGRENRERTRPELAAHVQNIDGYHTVFLGFPIWYYDMPMAVYTFLEEYDLSGKKIIPFVTSGGSDFSDPISEIQKLQPEAEVETDGFKARHSRIDDVTPEDVGEWIAGLNL